MSEHAVHVCLVDVDSDHTRTITGHPSNPHTLALVHRSGRTVSIVDEATDATWARIAHLRDTEPPPRRAWLEHPQADRPKADQTRVDHSLGEQPLPIVPTGSGSTPPKGPHVAVIVCTTGRHPLLPRVVDSLMAQSHTDFELIIVDNAPHTGHTRAALAPLDDPRLRIVNASRPGLSNARNCGVVASKAPIVAFTDDDAVADSHWLEHLIEPLRYDTTGCVGATTGIVLPLDLDHPSQRWYEQRGGFPKDPQARVWALAPLPPALNEWGTRADGGPFYPYTTARIGAGVSMAYTRNALYEAGPFDPALGAGTPTRGGEDLDMFRRILSAGWAIIHTPDAWTFHSHRPTTSELERQLRGNGSGMSALLTKAMTSNPTCVLDMLSRLPAVARRLRPHSTRIAGTDPTMPSGLIRHEMIGFLEGPALYALAAWRAQRQQRARRRQLRHTRSTNAHKQTPHPQGGTS